MTLCGWEAVTHGDMAAYGNAEFFLILEERGSVLFVRVLCASSVRVGVCGVCVCLGAACAVC